MLRVLRDYSRSANESKFVSGCPWKPCPSLLISNRSPAMEVDDIRGVNSSGAITKLLSFDLIREDGKKEVLGRPNLYVTTDYFLDYMGINHLEELPMVEET